MTEGLPLAAPVWLFHGLLLLTLTLHLLVMNMLAGGAVLASVTAFRRGEDLQRATFLNHYSMAAPVLVAATVTLGVAPLLFLQVLYGGLFFSSSIVMAWSWLGIVALVLVAYGVTYAISWSTTLSIAARRWLQLAVTGLLLVVGFIYTNNMTLMLTPERVAERYFADGRGLHLNFGEPTLMPRYLHFMLGAVAIAGLTLAGAGVLRRRLEPEFSTWAIRQGLRWFAGATALNLVTGIWWFVALPSETRVLFAGGDLYATLVLGLGTVTGLAALAFTVAALTKKEAGVLIWIAAGAAVVTVAAMTLARDVVRQAALARAGFVPGPDTAPQWVPIGLFAVLLVVAVLTVVWMVSRLGRIRI